MPSRRMVISHSRPTIEADDVAAVSRVMLSGNLAQGAEVRAFEAEVAEFLGLPGAVATSSGTAALHLALLVLGVGPGREVLIPSYSCVALLHAAEEVGATARLIDCQEGDVNAWVDDAARQVGPYTAAVVLPHMFGRTAAIEAFRALGVPIIENCAQALGATRGGIPAGRFGDLTVLSFYATKMITTGEGGMLLARSDSLLAEATDLREYDKRHTYRHRFNFKMTDFQATLGRSQFRKLARFLDRRRSFAKIYHELLDPVAPAYTPPRDGDACYRYVTRAPDVAAFLAEMLAHGVECARPVFRPLHEVVAGSDCPNADAVFQDAVSLPIYPSLTEEVVHAIGELAVRTVEQQRSLRRFPEVPARRVGTW